jgi:hypothetical protein
MHHHDKKIQDAKIQRNNIQLPDSKHKSLIEATTENTHHFYVGIQNHRHHIYIYSSYILLGVHTPIFNIPHIEGYYTSLSFLIYLINYSNIPQYK